MLDIIGIQEKARVLACDPRQNIYQFNHVTGQSLRAMPVSHRKTLAQSSLRP